MFDENKKKGAEGLKFAKTFQITLCHKDTTQLGNTDDFYSVGEILGFFGSSVDNFSDAQEALKRAVYLADRNQQEFG